MGAVLSSKQVESPSAEEIVAQLEATRIERELAIAQLLERRRQAYKLAEEKEKLNWTGSAGALTTALSVVSSYYQRNLLHLLPVVPIAAYLGYKAHYCYGDKLKQISRYASELLIDERDSQSSLPATVEDVRQRMQEIRKLRSDEDEDYNF